MAQRLLLRACGAPPCLMPAEDEAGLVCRMSRLHVPAAPAKHAQHLRMTASDQHYCLQYRWGVFKGMYDAIAQNEGGLDQFSQGAPALSYLACICT